MAASSCPAAPAIEDTLVTSLIVLMEQGIAPWRKEWDGSSGGHHVNLLSGRPYRGANPILLTIGLHQRGAVLPFWCGAAEARTHGLLPKPGSRAVTVLRPQVQRRKASLPPSPPVHAGEARVEEERRERPWVRYRPVALFNAEDLEGGALAALISARQSAHQRSCPPEPERLGKAEAVLRAWPVSMAHGGSKAYYNLQSDTIQLPDRRAFHSSAAFYATWAHEALHSTGHPSRLNRDLSGALGSKAYAREELVAELGAVLLGDRLEIGSDVSNHAAYLAEWIQLLQDSPTLLYRLLSDARRAADLIFPLIEMAQTSTSGGSGAGPHQHLTTPAGRGGESARSSPPPGAPQARSPSQRGSAPA